MLPDVGENEEIDGGPPTVKVAGELLAVPPGVTTVIAPLVAPLGTVAVICVLLSTEKVVALVPLNATALAPVKALPLMTTDVPMLPLLGVKPAIDGTPARLEGSPTTQLTALAGIDAALSVATCVTLLTAPL
jgi:hypothetical protein